MLALTLTIVLFLWKELISFSTQMFNTAQVSCQNLNIFNYFYCNIAEIFWYMYSLLYLSREFILCVLY